MAIDRGHDAFALLAVGAVLIALTGCAGGPVAPQLAKPQHATISLIEYSDFLCPSSASGQQIIERVLAVYGQVVKYEYRHHVINIHPYAMTAARRYEALHDRDPAAADRLRRALFTNQTRLSTEKDSFLDELITQLGYDPQVIARESETPAITERLDGQMAEFDAYKLVGTPGYIVAGITMQGPKSFSEFEQIICYELRRAGFAGTAGHSSSEKSDCWTLVKPDWKRLDELENGGLATEGVP
jgi:predicted DsbA family dithiol-disulfide isomerase